eukprot:1147992-Pelagomonas_calceolata.AAC.15
MDPATKCDLFAGLIRGGVQCSGPIHRGESGEIPACLLLDDIALTCPRRHISELVSAVVQRKEVAAAQCVIDRCSLPATVMGICAYCVACPQR